MVEAVADGGRALDEVAANATVAPVTRLVDGWLAKAAPDLPFRRANAVLPALGGLGADIKALPELDAATIAALVPNGLAQAVADELHKRLAG